jgi:site-specific DNA-methyltransferase (adenine-specific)
MQDIKINDQTPHCSKHVLPLVVGGLTITCEDNMQLMSRYPDNYFDLAIVDPPYGIGADKAQNAGGEKWGYKEYKKTDWDSSIPSEEYFKELFRVSKNQIVWGGNYMTEFLPPSMGWIIWDKGQRGFSLADGEMAWTSFNKAMRIFEFSRAGCIKSNNTMIEKFHPTAKPFELYKYCLDKYAKQGDKILDTHLGSGSIAIACHDYKFELTACELDPEYFEKAKQRIINHVAQQSLF